MKTILVGTDFSPAALNAVNYAADMALAINANMLLLHVYQAPVSYSDYPLVVNLEDMEQSAESEINELKIQVTRRTFDKVNISTEVIMGVYFQELKTICERIKPYTVVMGSQGTTVLEHLFLGSDAVYAMKHLIWPLITVPPGAAFSTVKKIGLACDFDKVVDTTPIDEIEKLVNDFNAELHVLNTGKKKVFNPDFIFQSGLLQQILATLKPFYHYISNENTDEGIMDFAEKNNIDLLIVLPKRHSLLDKLIHKSHTKQLVLHCHLPVMALHQESF